MKDDTLWEMQWHPSDGGAFRRVVLTRRGLRGVLMGLGLLGLAVLAVMGALPLGLRGFLTSFTVDAARHENRALKAQEDSLREQAVALGGRLYELVQRGRRMAWTVGTSSQSWLTSCQLPPQRGLDDGSTIDWLTQVGERIETLGDELAAAAKGSLRCPLPSLPTGPPLDHLRAVPVSLFGWRESPFTGKTLAQYGTILAAPEGEAVLATGAGRVLFAGGVRERKANEWTRFGTVVVVDHGGEVATVFGHLRDVLVKRGQSVRRGDRLGTVGQTGWTRVPALYYEVRWPVAGGSRPIDPGLVTISLPVDELDARFSDPTAGLPTGWALLEHLVGSGVSRGPAHRPVRHDPQHVPRSAR
ncbi:MAG: M23 family metallopeptidase [Acidobacteriia bacterium]|nr:M23 family metallopeptidase [Terriglobia bacterium]